MIKVFVFAGTTEGYEIIKFLDSFNKFQVFAFVATEYGKESILSNRVIISSKPLNEEELKEKFNLENPDLVIDATHPFATIVTENIQKANNGAEYIRLIREKENLKGGLFFKDHKEAMEYLNKTQGNILLTTGSKDLKTYCQIDNYKDRLFARVLSIAGVVENAQNLGLKGKHLIAMEGPFTEEMNLATLKQYNCKYLVTKDSGKSGGVEDKIRSALKINVIPIIIGRPTEEEGMTLNETKVYLKKAFDLGHCLENIYIIGIGIGNSSYLTEEAKEKISSCEVIIGAKRMVEAISTKAKIYIEYNPLKILEAIKENSNAKNIGILCSGDTGFYSNAKRLYEVLDRFKEKISCVCGISSINYFFSKLMKAWQDVNLVSFHGREANIISEIIHNKKTFSLIGLEDSVSFIAGELLKYKIDAKIYVGENLSYNNEKIIIGEPEDFISYTNNKLSVIYIENMKPFNPNYSFKDEDFLRDKVPMTKEEIRTLIVSKLDVNYNDNILDFGAGSGSCTIALAHRAYKGKTFGIEKNPVAIELIKKNLIKTKTSNVTVIEGSSPDLIDELPKLNCAFIGGSSGCLKEVVNKLFLNNKDIKIVITAITIETLNKTMDLIKELKINNYEILQSYNSKSKKVGPYNMMISENPIFIITIKGE